MTTPNTAFVTFENPLGAETALVLNEPKSLLNKPELDLELLPGQFFGFF